jgi:phosphatidate phosphatase APP1
MKPGLQRPLLSVGIATCILLAFVAGAQFRTRLKVTAFDTLGSPDQEIALRAKVERDGPGLFNPDLRGRRLQFLARPWLEREAVTDHEGTATIAVMAPAAPGRHDVTSSVARGQGLANAEATVRLFLWPADSTILVTDVDHTVSNLSEPLVPVTPNRDIPPLPGAVESLERLAHAYRVVYLSARDDLLYNKTRAWLQDKRFPDGPLFCRDYYVGQSQAGFKTRLLADLKKRFPKVVVGVGDRASDAEAYLANGMAAYLIDPESKGRFPAGSIAVRSWAEVEKRLLEKAAEPAAKPE